MADFRTMYQTYMITRANKRSSDDSVIFELHWQRDLLYLVDDINNRRLQPTSYTFVSKFPKPREIFASCMQIRIANHYIDIRMRPLIEAKLTKRTYNNRKGLGLNACINQIIADIYEKSCGFTKDTWIITWDLKGYFPNAKQDISYQQYIDIAKSDYKGDDIDDLLYLIGVSIFAYPTEHCEILSTPEERALIAPDKSLFNKQPGIGGTIGNLQWQNGMNLYTSTIDHWLVDDCHVLHNRYVDDNCAVTDNKTMFLTYVMPELRKRYAEFGCMMHPTKFTCQHWSKGVTFCGYTIKCDRLYANPRSIGRCKNKIRMFNRCKPSDAKVLTFLSSINSYFGIFKNCNGYAIIRDMVELIDAAWLEYVQFDASRSCMVATEGHDYKARLITIYNIKLRNYDKRGKVRKAPKARRAAATPAGCNVKK